MAQLPTKVVTGPVRLSYAHLFEPYAQQEDQTPKYSVQLLVPKTDKETIAKIEQTQKNALENGKNKFPGGKIPKNWKNTFRDADEEQDTEEKPELAGMMFMTISSNTKPGIVDKYLRPITKEEGGEDEVYSGCYARVSMNAAAFSVSGNNGVSFYVNNVMKVEDGERLGGKSSANDDFSAFAEDLDELL